MECAAVATDVSGIPEAVEGAHTDLTVPSRNLRALAEMDEFAAREFAIRGAGKTREWPDMGSSSGLQPSQARIKVKV